MRAFRTGDILARPRKGHRWGGVPRCGALLLLVLVVVASLSIAIYAFTSLSTSQLYVIDMHRKQLAQRLLAESAIERMRAQLDLSTGLHAIGDRSRYHLSGPLPGLPAGYLSVISSMPKGQEVQWGMLNESAKLNLNYLASPTMTREVAHSKLMRFPGMTSQFADGILKLLRGDESSTSQSGIANPKPLRRIQDLRELMQVPGITTELLFGEDTNNNGYLDPNENDGEEMAPKDNRDGQLQFGWARHWTVVGGEATIRPDGRSKIRLNQTDRAKLYDELIEVFPKEEVRFVLAWRTAPAIYEGEGSATAIREARQADAALRESSLQDRLRQQLGDDSGKRQDQNLQSSERAGIFLSASPGIRIPSLIALADCKVQIAIDGKDEVLKSPFASEGQTAVEWLKRWEATTTLCESAVDESRIDIHQATFETLMTIQGMTEPLAMGILRTRSAMADHPEEFESVSWLVRRGLIDWSALRKIAPECTTEGSVYRGIAVGQLSGSRTVSMIEFALDRRWGPTRLMRRVDLPIRPGFAPP